MRRENRDAGGGVKVVVVGGGSTYTPELIEGVADRDGILHVDELVLQDVDAERLEIVGGLARRMLERRDWPGRLVLSTDHDGAFEGAGFVLLQIRVDGRDVLPDLLDRESDWLADLVHLPVELVRALRAVPSYYLRYFYMTAEVLAEQLNGHSRAEDVIAIERDLLERYRDPALTE